MPGAATSKSPRATRLKRVPSPVVPRGFSAASFVSLDTPTAWPHVFLTRLPGGPRNVLPGMVIFSVFGAGGQAVANVMATRAREPLKPKTSWLDSKWSPVTPLTDQQYEKLLQEKILKLDVEIAVIDEDIAALREAEQKGRTEGNED